MQLDEAQERFIEMWGALGTEWGITRSMAQIHALLLLSPKPLCADEVMDKLQIARGNANTNLRALLDWGLVKKEFISGDRKEYYAAYKDMWHVAKQVVVHRKQRELDPLIRALQQLKDIESTPENAEQVKYFESVTNDVSTFADKADSILNGMINADQNWLLNTFLRLVK